TPGHWSGHAGLWEAFRDLLGAWDELHVEAAEYRELDDEHVLVHTRLSGRGKTSGMEPSFGPCFSGYSTLSKAVGATAPAGIARDTGGRLRTSRHGVLGGRLGGWRAASRMAADPYGDDRRVDDGDGS